MKVFFKKYGLLLWTFAFWLIGLVFQTDGASIVHKDIDVLGILYVAISSTILGSELFYVFNIISGKYIGYIVFSFLIIITSFFTILNIDNPFMISVTSSLIGVFTSGLYAVYQKRRED